MGHATPKNLTMRRTFGACSLAGLAVLAACQSRAVDQSIPSAAPQQRSVAQTTHARVPAKIINWPQFRFDDNHTGVNPHETILTGANVSRLRPAFAAQLGGLVDFSSPAVVNGVAYIGSTDGRLWAYPSTGCGQTLCATPLWTSTSLGEIVSSPTVARGFVYIGSQTSFSSNDGKLDVFSAAGCGQAACAPIWQGVAGSDAILQSSPTVAKNRVFIGAHDGVLYVFNANGCGATTCQPTWTAKTGASIESTPTVFNNTVFVGSDDGKLYAFKAGGCGSASCKPIWTGALGSAAFASSPAIFDGIVYMGSQHALSAFRASGCGGSNCTPLWQSSNSSDFFNGSPAVTKNHIYIGVEDGLDVYATKGCGQSKCPPQWLDEGSGFQAAVVSSPTVANGVVYAGRNTGEVLAWHAGSCHKNPCLNIWSGGTKDQIVSSSPTVVNGFVYIGSADDTAPSNISGRLYVFALQE